MTVQEMENRLKEHFPDGKVAVNDLTGTEDHWEVYVESARFAGQSRIEQQRTVMSAFTEELKTGEVHALTIRTVLRKD